MSEPYQPSSEHQQPPFSPGQQYQQPSYQQPQYQPPQYQQPSYQQQTPYGAQQYGAQGYPQAPPGYGLPPMGPPGRIRPNGISILLFIVTFGIYGIFWYYLTHEEMKKHTGEGLGGPIALVIAIFAGIISPFLSSGEVGKLYERRGQPQPVTAATGLWYIPGFVIIVGPIIWFVKTNNALNDYWRSVGATG